MDENTWVDFRAVKSRVSIRMVLSHYGINGLRKSGKELRGRCPLHKGEGKDTFHANEEKNAFRCFSCQAKGNVLDFVAAMESCTIRDAAAKLASWFSVPAGQPPSSKAPKPQTQASGGVAVAVAETGAIQGPLATKEADVGQEEPNKPLPFQLQGIEFSHPYLVERGIDSETAEYFGVGFFPGKGSMAGRVVIPIENERGELVAYAGRAIDGSEPKYKLPVGFKKSQVLYNLPRALEEGSDGTVVVVEGFFDCMKVVLAGFPCVALIGCSLSSQQETLLCSHFKRVVIMLDGDEAGRTATAAIAARLARHLWVRVIELPDGQQPDMLSAEELAHLLP